VYSVRLWCAQDSTYVRTYCCGGTTHVVHTLQVLIQVYVVQYVVILHGPLYPFKISVGQVASVSGNCSDIKYAYAVVDVTSGVC
jgi:hypothetical protein